MRLPHTSSARRDVALSMGLSTKYDVLPGPRNVARSVGYVSKPTGVDPKRVYRDKLSGMSTREERPGLVALLDYARPGDCIVVVGIDRLGRNAAEVTSTIRELGEQEIVLRSLREGIDSSNATGRMVAGVLASLAELELELGRERRTAAREARRARGQSIGRPKALDEKKAALAQRMHANGESASTIAATLGVSRATVYRVLAERNNETDSA